MGKTLLSDTELLYGQWAKYKFRFFLSYSHSDARWADRLERKFRDFIMPSELLQAWTPFGPPPRRLKPFFRDRGIMGAHHSLDQSLRQALDNSATLVVLCSPDAARSTHVTDEIVHFLKTGRRDRIRAIIIDGVPNDPTGENECLPEPLRYELDEEGNIDRTRPNDPVAADARAEGDSWPHAFFKLVGGMVGLDADVISRRDQIRDMRERRRRTALYGTIAASLATAVMIVGGLYLQRQKMLEADSISLANRALDVLAEGDRERAQLIALEGANAGHGIVFRRPEVEQIDFALQQSLAPPMLIRPLASGVTAMTLSTVASHRRLFNEDTGSDENIKTQLLAYTSVPESADPQLSSFYRGASHSVVVTELAMSERDSEVEIHHVPICHIEATVHDLTFISAEPIILVAALVSNGEIIICEWLRGEEQSEDRVTQTFSGSTLNDVSKEELNTEAMTADVQINVQPELFTYNKAGRKFFAGTSDGLKIFSIPLDDSKAIITMDTDLLVAEGNIQTTSLVSIDNIGSYTIFFIDTGEASRLIFLESSGRVVTMLEGDFSAVVPVNDSEKTIALFRRNNAQAAMLSLQEIVDVGQGELSENLTREKDGLVRLNPTAFSSWDIEMGAGHGALQKIVSTGLDGTLSAVGPNREVRRWRRIPGNPCEGTTPQECWRLSAVLPNTSFEVIDLIELGLTDSMIGLVATEQGNDVYLIKPPLNLPKDKILDRACVDLDAAEDRGLDDYFRIARLGLSKARIPNPCWRQGLNVFDKSVKDSRAVLREELDALFANKIGNLGKSKSPEEFFVSQIGLDLIEHFEGLALKPYQDVAGIWTIGYGYIGEIVIGGKQYPSVADAVEGNGIFVISEPHAEELLLLQLRPFEQEVNEAVQVSINQNQFDALLSLTYQIGISAFLSSTALKRLNDGDYQGAAEAITWWNRATVNGQKQVVAGLVNRRAAEKALFLTPVSGQQFVSNEPRNSIQENSPRRSNLGQSRTVEGASVAGSGSAGAGDDESPSEE